MSVKMLTNNIPSDQPHSSPYPKENHDCEADPRAGLIFKTKVLSKFDSTIEIKQKLWAVTLVVDKSGSYIIPTTFHARMIIEGVKEDIGPFFQIAHLQGPKTWRNPKEVSNCWFG